MFVWTGEVVISVILAIVAAIFYVLSGSFTAPVNPVDIGPAAFPRLMAIIILLLAAAQIFLSIKKNRAPDSEKVTFGYWQGCLAGLALMCAYAFLMPRLGYYVGKKMLYLVLLLTTKFYMLAIHSLNLVTSHWSGKLLR